MGILLDSDTGHMFFKDVVFQGYNNMICKGLRPFPSAFAQLGDVSASKRRAEKFRWSIATQSCAEMIKMLQKKSKASMAVVHDRRR